MGLAFEQQVVVAVERDELRASDLRGQLPARSEGHDNAVPPGYRQLDYTVRIGGDGTHEQFLAIHEEVLKSSPSFFNLSQPICMNGRLEIA